MNMALIDWLIVAVTLGSMIFGVVVSKKYMTSVADFLAAGRTAGRYILAVSGGLAGLGAITIVGLLEMNYVAGFSMSWWGFTMSVFILIITVSGWVIYRFRQTRALTLAQFFEMRYSKSFRIFAGLIAFLSGLINFGIFPAVGARFFIYFCGIPHHFPVLGLMIPSFPLIMASLLGISLYFVFSGGQIAVIVTDFLQGIFVNIIFVLLVVFLFVKVDWSQIVEALSMAPENASLINPFKTSHVEDFNLWYFLIGVFGVFYGAMSWQGTQAYNASAHSAHEAKMSGVLNNWRGYPQNLFLLFVPIICYTIMHHPDFSGTAEMINATLAGVGNEAVQNQLRSPVMLTKLLPIGFMGAFAAVMLGAFISTHDTYLHSWGSIFIQDIVMPFRKKPLSNRQHLKALRLAIVGVAVFIFFFSLIFQQSQYIFLFFAITGAIFAGGSGAVIIGGLYWKRGTTAAAWSALITGSTIAVGGIVIHQLTEDFPVNGQQFWAIAMGASTIVYVLVSLLGKREEHNLDKLLHRGKYATSETKVVNIAPSRGFRILGMGKEFTKGDKAIYIATYIVTGGWIIVFIAGTIYNLTHQVEDSKWAEFWKFYFYFNVVMCLFVIVWFTIGGIRNLKTMFRRLGAMKKDAADDGIVRRESTGPE